MAADEMAKWDDVFVSEHLRGRREAEAVWYSGRRKPLEDPYLADRQKQACPQMEAKIARVLADAKLKDAEGRWRGARIRAVRAKWFGLA